MEAFIEAVTPDIREQLNTILDALRADHEKSWRMLPDGTYLLEDDEEGTSSQEALYRYFSTRSVSLQEEPPALSPDPVPETEGEPEEKPEEKPDIPAPPEKESFFSRLKKLFA